LLVAALVLAGIGSYSYREYRRHDDTAALVLGVLMAIGTAWSLVYAVQFSYTAAWWMRGWKLVENLVTVLLGPTWLVFGLVYANRADLLTRRTLLLLAVEPVIVAVATITNPLHGRVYERMWVVGTSPPVYLGQSEGIIWHGHAVYSYLLVTAGSIVLIYAVRNARTLYRWQAVSMVFGAVLPLFANVVFAAELVESARVNLTPVAFVGTGVAFLVAIVRYRMLDVRPVARNSVIDSMPDGYVLLDEQDRIVDLNPAAGRFIGRPAEEVVGHPLETVFPACAAVLEESTGADGEVGGDGQVVEVQPDRRFVDVSVSELYDETGFVGRLVFLRDVTERRRLQNRHQRLIEKSSDVFAILDTDGIIQYQSPSVEQVFGYDPTDLTGTPAASHVHPEDRDRVVGEFFSVLEDPDRTSRIEYRYEDADGQWRYVESFGQNLLDDPFVEGVVIHSRDVTERRRHEEQLREKNEQLDRFASVVSHDLRNPLGLASGHLQLAREGNEESFEAVESAHDRMERIIEDVLQLNRLGDGIGDLEATALPSVAREAWSNVDTHDASIVIDTDAEILADNQRLLRLLENLFRNAVEHGSTSPDSQAQEDAVEHGASHADESASADPVESAGSGEGSITASRETGDEHAVSDLSITIDDTEPGFYVADSGDGASDEVLASIFEAGYTTASDGTGLGLSIVESIADAHGWTVTADHAEEGGVQFTFEGVERP
jgi:PAS domain S-box-containing protein